MADLGVTPSSVQLGANGKFDNYTSGAAFDAGDLLALDGSGNAIKCDASAAAPANIPVGIALNSCPGAGQPVQATADAPQLAGFAPTQGEIYVAASDNAGKLCSLADLATGDTVSFIGIGGSSVLAVKLFAPNIQVP